MSCIIVGLTTIVLLKFLHPAALQPNNSISEDQKPLMAMVFITTIANEPPEVQIMLRIMHFMFAWKFY